MKSRLISILLLGAALAAPSLSNAQSPNAYNVTGAPPPSANPTVSGDMTIAFNTANQADDKGNVPKGVADLYTLHLNIANSVLLHGTIVRLPTLSGGVFGGSQAGNLTFDIDTDVINPKNPHQVKNIGKLAGVVPVDKQNVYHFDTGTLAINTYGIGMAPPIDSRFDGLARGKPPADTSLLTKIRKLPISITRSIHGQNVTIVVSDYDVMRFENHILAAGPIQTYPATGVTGSMLYDYQREQWHFQGLSLSYSLAGQAHNDVLTGDIRWVKDPEYAKTGAAGFGNSEYELDVRFNEPPPTEGAAFAAPTNESDFFSVDESIQGLTGTLKYHDSFKDPSHASDDSVVTSTVKVDLVGNHLTRAQVVAVVKLLMVSAVVPMNSN